MSLIPPTENHLSRLYYELEKIGARSVGLKKPWPYSFSAKEDLFVLAADLSRFDPRLLEVLVQFGLERWEDLNPQWLRSYSKKMAVPQTLGVIAAFAMTAATQERGDPDREQNFFWDYITAGLSPVEPQFYFRDLYLPGSSMAERAVRESLQEFKQWGFFGRERVIVDPVTKKNVGTWDQESRLNILRRLFSKKKKITIAEYLEELHQTVSRQQALQDFKALGAKQEGGGRSTVWKAA